MLMSRRTQSDPDLGRLLQRRDDGAVTGNTLQPQRATEDTPFELRVLETALDVVSIGPASCPLSFPDSQVQGLLAWDRMAVQACCPDLIAGPATI